MPHLTPQPNCGCCADDCPATLTVTVDNTNCTVTWSSTNAARVDIISPYTETDVGTSGTRTTVPGTYTFRAYNLDPTAYATCQVDQTVVATNCCVARTVLECRECIDANHVIQEWPNYQLTVSGVAVPVTANFPGVTFGANNCTNANGNWIGQWGSNYPATFGTTETLYSYDETTTIAGVGSWLQTIRLAVDCPATYFSAKAGANIVLVRASLISSVLASFVNGTFDSYANYNCTFFEFPYSTTAFSVFNDPVNCGTATIDRYACTDLTAQAFTQHSKIAGGDTIGNATTFCTSGGVDSIGAEWDWLCQVANATMTMSML